MLCAESPADKMSPLERAILDKPEHELLQIVGHYATMRKLGAQPQTLETLRREGHDWFLGLRPQLAERLCHSETVRKLAADGGPDDREALFMVISDLALSCVGNVPATYVSALVLRLGLQALCATHCEACKDL